jgi:MoaA/NifB/PqqE/SkfB family radical SAM enzyme
MSTDAVALPSFVQIEPVGQCNLRCRMCPIEFRKDGPPHGPPAFMKFEDFARLIDEFPHLEELHLQGLGEPMMHPRFFDMIAYAVRRGARVTTNSNMTLLNPERAERCVTSGLGVLHVSIDGATPETYERIRVRSRLDKVLRNLRLLLDARRRLGSTRPHLHLVMVVMRQNLHELPELVRLAHDWEMEEVWVQHLCHDFAESHLPEQYRPMRSFVDEQTLLREDPGRVARYFEEARAEAARVGVRLRLPKPRQGRYPATMPGRARCDWPWERAYLSYDGRAMPCCTVATPDRANFGSASAAGFAAIWHGADYHDFRRRLDSDKPPEICRTCAVYNGTF